MNPIRIVSSVKIDGQNPYLFLFYQALEQHGLEFVGAFEPYCSWVNRNLSTFDVMHFHWPEFLVRKRPPWLQRFQQYPGCWQLGNQIRNLLPFVMPRQFKALLKLVKKHDKKIAWTVHNIEPHEITSRAQRELFELLAEFSDVLICHDDLAAAECRQRFGSKSNVLVMPHGNYKGAYPEPRDRSIVRSELGIGEGCLLLGCLGAIRNYKGFNIACEAMQHLAEKVHLLVAGKPHRQHDEKVIESVTQDPRITYLGRRLSDQEFADFSSACDLILLPYLSVTGSGALLAALTFGRGVIASDLPFFRNILMESPNAGRLAPTGDVRQLASVIEDFLDVPMETRNQSARELADVFDWENVVAEVAAKLIR